MVRGRAVPAPTLQAESLRYGRQNVCATIAAAGDGGTAKALLISHPCAWRDILEPIFMVALITHSYWRSILLLLFISAQSHALDLTNAVVVTPPGLSRSEKKAVAMLLDEAEKRAHFRWHEAAEWPSGEIPVIAVGPASAIGQFAGSYSRELGTGAASTAPEGFRLAVKGAPGHPAVLVVGNDARGVLFGVGRLLREIEFTAGSARIRDGLEIVTAPKYPLRGHQLGFRPKCNSYDAWDLPAWEQYFRDLAVFGSNAIELIPPRSDDDADSPHFPRPPMEMMVGMSGLADAYGLDVWIWYPAMDKDYSDPATVESALREWAEVFRRLPRIDAVFVPGGDPGHTQPKHLMALLEKQTKNLHQFHPKAQMWVSPQSFNQSWLDEFFEIVTREKPAWLSGVVFGPQVRIALPRLRELVPKQYPIRHYPDITHSRQCEYPVQDWDVAYALTEARECINPRPEAEAVIFRKTQPYTIGFLSYSEGCNDDVNKFVWSGLGWDPDQPVAEILWQFSRYFIGASFTDDFAQGLLALERNWRGPLLANEDVFTTLAQFQAMERRASPATLRNWRFQQALFRAYYDAYIRRRLLYETELEDKAKEILRSASAAGTLAAMQASANVLERGITEPVARDWHNRISELAEALFQSIGMQLSVEKYKAIAVDRGASLDTIDYPLNNRVWLKEQFARIRRLPSESERLRALEPILNWTDPGPGGFYDDLGNVARQSHLVRGLGFQGDPGSMESPRNGFEEDLVVDDEDEKPEGARRVSWMDHAETLYETPLQMRYTGLDPQARYRLRVVYGGDSPKKKIRLVAGRDIEVHPYMAKPFPYKPIEFALPSAITAAGDLTLTWYGEPGLGGNGRGCQVSEVWLLKERQPSNP
jgi:hypothetical protein